jgi:hypothetical protein
MINISRIILLFCLTFSSAFGQTQNLILTREQNNIWLDSLKILTLAKQLLTIKDRLIADTSVFVRQFHNDRIRVVEQIGNKVYGDGKPLMIIGGYPMIIDNKTETKKIIRLTQLLDTINIKTIFVFSGNDPAMSAIYGNSAQSGIIVMTLTRTKFLNKFRQLKLKPNY